MNTIICIIGEQIKEKYSKTWTGERTLEDEMLKYGGFTREKVDQLNSDLIAKNRMPLYCYYYIGWFNLLSKRLERAYSIVNSFPDSFIGVVAEADGISTPDVKTFLFDTPETFVEADLEEIIL